MSGFLEPWSADKARKSDILYAVVEVPGIIRKGVIKRFRRMQTTNPAGTEKRGRRRYYTRDCIAALKDVWEIGNEPCGENLHLMISECIDTQVRAGNWQHGDEATSKLRSMSLGSVKTYVSTFSPHAA